jgi:hypothetical protein
MKKICCFAMFFTTTLALFAQEVVIDMRYNVLRAEPSRDYFNWVSSNRRIQDSYDAVTGASVARSTQEFDSIRFDTPASRKYTLPRGIRHLLLFPVASRRYTNNFYLTVKEDAEKLIIRFMVYGTIYQIQTDDNKKIDIATACFLAEGITQSNALVSPLKPQYVKSSGNPNDMNSLDWNKVRLVPDTADPGASRTYRGTLTAGYADGVLTIKGILPAQ